MDTQETRQQGAVRAVLRNELTWVIFIAVFLWGGVQGVVLPIQRLQIQLAQIQSDVSIANSQYAQIVTDHRDISNRVTKLETEIIPLLRQ